jgi:hypothetical protein
LLKGDDNTNYINVKHSCQEFSQFQIERLVDYFSAGPSEMLPGLTTNEIEDVSRRLSKAEFQPERAPATQAGLSSVD